MNRLRDITRLVLLAAALGLAGFWIITGSGLYGWLSEVQASLFGGEFYPMLSGALALVATVVPAGVLGRLLRPKVERGPVEAFRADPAGAVACGPVVLGIESLIGWPKAGVTASVAGIELRRGGRSVHCPWPLFEADGSPVTNGVDSVVVPVRADRVAGVELRVGGTVVERGAAVSTPFFKWHGSDQVGLTIDVALPVGDFGRLLAVAAARLGEGR